MLQNNFLRGASAAVLLVLICIIGSAQEFRGSITGKVTDPNGAIIPGASVTIKNVDTNVQATANTNDEGSYEFRLLLPGKYTLAVTAQGFSATTREGIEIRVADKLTLDVSMQAAGVTGMVTDRQRRIGLGNGSGHHWLKTIDHLVEIRPPANEARAALLKLAGANVY